MQYYIFKKCVPSSTVSECIVAELVNERHFALCNQIYSKATISLSANSWIYQFPMIHIVHPYALFHPVSPLSVCLIHSPSLSVHLALFHFPNSSICASDTDTGEQTWSSLRNPWRMARGSLKCQITHKSGSGGGGGGAGRERKWGKILMKRGGRGTVHPCRSWEREKIERKRGKTKKKRKRKAVCRHLTRPDQTGR